jgi:hypothetical protein
VSRRSAGVLHACDAPGCTALAFTADGLAPLGWLHLPAASQSDPRVYGPRIAVDVCETHPDWLADHRPVLPGTTAVRIEGEELVLSHGLGCAGCGWETDQVLPAAGTAAERNELLTRIWLMHLDTPPPAEPAPVPEHAGGIDEQEEPPGAR